MKMRMVLTVAAVIVALPGPVHAQQTGQQCYTANCTGATITSKRKCYLCCSDKCSENGTQLTHCQEECDKAHPRLMSEDRAVGLPAVLRGGIPDDEAGQVKVLMDDAVVEWALEDGVVTDATVEFLDWFAVGTGEQAQRWALITLSHVLLEYPATRQAREEIRSIFFEVLEEDRDPKIRRLALGLIAEAGLWWDDPASTRRVIKALRDDPSPLVREQGIRLLRRY